MNRRRNRRSFSERNASAHEKRKHFNTDTARYQVIFTKWHTDCHRLGGRLVTGELVFFTVQPTNLSVYSRISIGQKIQHLMQLLSAQPDLEIVCTDARENFDDNKLYLDSRMEDETNGKVRELLNRDKVFLDEIQLQMSTAREFMFVARLRNETDEQSFANLNRSEKLMNEQGFDCT